jgi:hypothetical protein
MPNTVGAKTWVLTWGHIPLESEGPEPECTSRDEIAILNASAHAASVEIEVFYADRDPVGPYRLTVQARRLRVVRFNDLIDPLPIPLDVDFSAVVRADRPIVVQFGRYDSDPRGATTALPALTFD